MNNFLSKTFLETIISTKKEIKKSTSLAELKLVKKEITTMKKLLSDMEKDITVKEKEYENKNNLKLIVE